MMINFQHHINTSSEGEKASNNHSMIIFVGEKMETSFFNISIIYFHTPIFFFFHEKLKYFVWLCFFHVDK